MTPGQQVWAVGIAVLALCAFAMAFLSVLMDAAV